MKRHFTPESLISPRHMRGRNPIGEENPLMEQFYQEQLKNRSKLPLDRASDEYQREIFIAMDKEAARVKEEEARRDRELKNIILNENRALIEEKERQRKEKKLFELREAQENNDMAVKKFEEERRREKEKRDMMIQIQAQDLQQQIMQKHAPVTWKSNDDIKHHMITSMHNEIQSQIQAKKASLESRKREMLEERKIAVLADQRAKEFDQEMRLKRIRDQERLKSELDKQVLKRKDAQSLSRIDRKEAPRRGDFYDPILNPITTQHKAGKGRGFFSPIIQVANNIFGN